MRPDPQPTGASRWLPVVGSLREQIAMQRALSPEQPGVIRLSCFDAEDVLAAICDKAGEPVPSRLRARIRVMEDEWFNVPTAEGAERRRLLS